MSNTQKLDALDKLIAAVEAGTLERISMHTVREAFEAHYQKLFMSAFSGSLDAALALHNALLLGWDLLISTYEDGAFEVAVAPKMKVHEHEAVHSIIARAWLLAMLKAYRAQVAG